MWVSPADGEIDRQVTTAVFEVDGRRWTVRVRTTRSEPSRLTCRSISPSAAPSHQLLEIEPMG